MGDLVQVYLYCVARLCRAMTALGTAGGLISKQGDGFEFITGELECHCLQHSGIVGRCYAIRAIRAAIEKRTEVHSRQCTSRFTPVLIHIFTGWRPRCSKNTSSRVQVILTGRPVRRASSQAQISWEKGSVLPPKPPPTLGAITRICDCGSFSTLLSSR